MAEKQVVIAFGGASPEHEVSVLTALQAVSALKERPVEIRPLYLAKSGRWLTGDALLELQNYEDLASLEKKASPCYLTRNSLNRPVLREEHRGLFSRTKEHTVDLILTAFHGSHGENGAFQGICEILSIPYTGCDVKSSALGMDKVAAKRLCRSAGHPVLDDIVSDEGEWVEHREKILDKAERLGYPLVVKPAELGSSIGVSPVSDPEALAKAVELVFRYDQRVLIEPAVQPLMEINCSVLGDGGQCRTSVCERPLGGEELLSFRDKYQSDGSGKGMASADREIPADISDTLRDRIQRTSRDIFALLGASGVARLDFLVHADREEYWFNEINTIPGSFSFYLWEATDLPFDDLLMELMELALARHSRRLGRVQIYETNLLSEKAVKGIKGLKGTKSPKETDS